MGNDGREERETLIVEIQRAFEDVRRGNGITLHQARVLDDYGNERQQAEARMKDTDRRWQDVSRPVIEKLGDACTFLDREGFRYYLPAYMLWTLRYGEESDSSAGDCIISNLCRRDRHADFELLDEAQKRIVTKFLSFLAEHCEEDWRYGKAAAAAIRGYWHKYL